MDSYRTQLHKLVAAFEQRIPGIPAMVAAEKDMVPPAIRALTMRRYAISRRDKVSTRLVYIQEAHRLLDQIEGKEVGPCLLPEGHSRPAERRRRRGVASVD